MSHSLKTQILRNTTCLATRMAVGTMNLSHLASRLWWRRLFVALMSNCRWQSLISRSRQAYRRTSWEPIKALKVTFSTLITYKVCSLPHQPKSQTKRFMSKLIDSACLPSESHSMSKTSSGGLRKEKRSSLNQFSASIYSVKFFRSRLAWSRVRWPSVSQ